MAYEEPENDYPDVFADFDMATLPFTSSESPDSGKIGPTLAQKAAGLRKYFAMRLNIANISMQAPQISDGNFHPAFINEAPFNLCKIDTTNCKPILRGKDFAEMIVDALLFKGETTVEVSDTTLSCYLAMSGFPNDLFTNAKGFLAENIPTFIFQKYGLRIKVESFDIIVPKDFSPYRPSTIKITYSLGKVPDDKNPLDFVGNNLLN